MHNSESTNNIENTVNILERDSSQTLNKVPLHHAFGEEEECQLPKQVHIGEFQAPYIDTADEADENRSYRSGGGQEDAYGIGEGLSKNMKESLDSNLNYRIESRSLAQNFI